MQAAQPGSTFRSPAQAEQWLQMFSRNALTMMGLRDVAAKCGFGSANFSDNAAILKLLANQICSGHLRICSMGAMGGGVATSAGAAGSSARSGTTANQDSKPFPIGERKKPAASSQDEPPPDPSTFSDDVDGGTQAAALAAAAAEGHPFCPE